MATAVAELGVPVETSGSDDIDMHFSGRFGFGIDQWEYQPFDVPAGVTRIRVATSHDDFGLASFARNVLDLGVFGPRGHHLGDADGFRGWSGGARSGFEISATAATPGYRTGPIEPGSWALAFGPVVLNPLGMAWRARVTLERGETAGPARETACAATGSAPRGAGWYRGDLHLHTVHSDGRYEPDELLQAARSAGLDFIVSTEHNTDSANRMWGQLATGQIMVIPGEEVTTRHGHWLALGLPPHTWVDWRYSPRDGVFPHYAAEVRAAGGMVVAAHPAVPMPGSAWEFGFAHVDGLEVWNGRWNVDDEITLRMWQQLLRRGRRVVAVGGSDSHGPHQPVGSPQTVVHATDSSSRAVIEALRRGRCYIARSQAVTVDLTASCPAGADALQAGPGQALPVPLQTPVSIRAVISGAPNTTVALVTAAGCIGRARVYGAEPTRLHWMVSAGEARFVRLEVRRAGRGSLSTMVALTNPVWLIETG